MRTTENTLVPPSPRHGRSARPGFVPGNPASHGRSRPHSERAAVLLEVVLALTLFVFAAGILSSSLQAAVDRTRKLHDQAHALDLAASVLAEIQIGIRPPQAAGPDHFEVPFTDWTWQIEAGPSALGGLESAGLQQVSVVIRHDAGTTVQRLSTVLPPPAASAATTPGLAAPSSP